MNFLIMTIGTRGDIQPFVALGLGLQRAGHAVTLATGPLYESFVRGYGLPFAPINDDMIRLTETSEGKAAVEGGKGFGLIAKVKPMIRAMLNDEWAAAQGADAIVFHPKTLGAYHIAEKLGIPTCLSMALPAYTPTRAFSNPILPPAVGKLGVFNKLSYGVTRMAAAPYIDVINDFRVHTLGLAARGRFANDLIDPAGRPVPAIYSYSPHVIPTPPDWPSSAAALGYWFLDRLDDWSPPADLTAFLEAGPPPVYVGFGSMPSSDPAARTRIILDAVRQAGVRAVIASGWGALEARNLPDTVFAIKEAPHDWLFPRMAAVVHHGGAGTTAAGLRFGKPTIICPFMGDQPFWGSRVAALGIGPQPIAQKRLTSDALAAALREATANPVVRSRAEALSEQIRAEDGVSRAVEWIAARLT